MSSGVSERHDLDRPPPPTPVQEAPRLARAIGLPASVTLLVKRDDKVGLALGGNKARKLRRLVAAARAGACDVLVTGGGPQSNHTVLTAAYGNAAGLDVVALVSASPGGPVEGNQLLHRLLGTELVWAGPRPLDELNHQLVAHAASLEAGGRRPYVIPVGGSSPTGALGYVDAAQELLRQDVAADLVVVATASGGTHAGLSAVLGHHAVMGVDVGAMPRPREIVTQLAREAAAAAGIPRPDGDAWVDLDHGTSGYGIPTPRSWAALRLAAETEGLILDPTYTSKALAGLWDAARRGDVVRNSTVVFWHTGGAGGLFTSATSHRLAAGVSGWGTAE